MPAVRTAQAQKGHGPVWMYRYEFISQMARKTGMLCSHAMDLPCDFNCLEFGFSAFVFQDEPKETVDKSRLKRKSGDLNFSEIKRLREVFQQMFCE